MQYLLSQQEFDDLRQVAKQRALVQREELQKLCTLAAQHIPVVRDWAPESSPESPLRPWGCILGPREQDPGYCDDCPCQKICPHMGKEFSQ